jgi:hypothetical protein
VSSGTPLLFERYTWTGRDYFKVLNESRYLSVSNGGQVGLYDWNGARTFQKESTWLLLLGRERTTVAVENQWKSVVRTRGRAA